MSERAPEIRNSRMAAALASMFTCHEIEVFLARLAGGRELLSHLSSEVAPSLYFSRLTAALERRAMINDDFFDALSSERPMRKGELDSIRSLWHPKDSGGFGVDTDASIQPHKQHSKESADRDDSMPASGRSRLVVELPGNFDDLDPHIIGKIILDLQRQIPGARFELVGVRKGSILVCVEGDSDDCQSLFDAFSKFRLSRVAGMPILWVSFDSNGGDVWLDPMKLPRAIAGAKPARSTAIRYEEAHPYYALGLMARPHSMQNVKQWLSNKFATLGIEIIEDIIGDTFLAFLERPLLAMPFADSLKLEAIFRRIAFRFGRKIAREESLRSPIEAGGSRKAVSRVTRLGVNSASLGATSIKSNSHELEIRKLLGDIEADPSQTPNHSVSLRHDVRRAVLGRAKSDEPYKKGGKKQSS